MKLRKYNSTDLDAIDKIDSLMKYQGDIKKENIICIIDDNDKVIGVGWLKFDENVHINGKHFIKLSTKLDEAHKCDTEADGMLVDGLIRRFLQIKNAISGEQFCLHIFCETDEIKDMQFFLEKGFSLCSVIPVLKYDLLQETKHYNLPDCVQINEYSFNNESIRKYYHAELIASGVPQSEADIKFMTGDPSFKCFVATCNSEVVGAISVWNIIDKRAATENIFVIPSYRRKNIARELIATAFDELKGRGMEIATLSMMGTNLPAMKLYLSCGYSLYYNLIEMLFE